MKSMPWVALFLGLAGLGCSLNGAIPPSATPFPATGEPPTAAPAVSTATASPSPEVPPEAILILEPGPGSRVLTPLHLSGEANSTFEQFLGVRLLLEDGSILAESPTLIQSEFGTRGVFTLDLPFTVAADRPGFLQVFSDSPRDGGITHLASVGVLLATGGLLDLRTAEVHPEDIQILQPLSGDTVRGGLLHVEGFGKAGFEQTLVIDILDADGVVVATAPVIIESEEMGVLGPFQADLSYTVSAEGPGRIRVRDVSPAFGGDVHVSSVDVTLAP